jgi:hypothetical protein
MCAERVAAVPTCRTFPERARASPPLPFTNRAPQSDQAKRYVQMGKYGSQQWMSYASGAVKRESASWIRGVTCRRVYNEGDGGTISSGAQRGSDVGSGGGQCHGV